MSGSISSVPRPFVVLRHDPPKAAPRDAHWDLMLDTGSTLRSWALAAFVVWNVPVVATQLPDHRRAYLSYEGPVSGDRGHVTRVAGGTYALELDTPRRIECRLQGAPFAAHVTLTRAAEATNEWTACFQRLPEDD